MIILKMMKGECMNYDEMSDFEVSKASGKFADLEVREIPDGVDWQIDEYDGNESIHEVHRTW